MINREIRFIGLLLMLFMVVVVESINAEVQSALPAFSDRTQETGINAEFIAGSYLLWDYTGGGAVGDFNNDGFQDIFILSGGANNLPDKLYINNGNGTFTNMAAAWGLTAVHKGKGASVGDYNRDGWIDIYVTSAGPANSEAVPCSHILYRNSADGMFTNVAVEAGVNCTSASIQDGFGSAFGDYDLDGNLDLFVAGFDNNNAGNRLFRNNGDGTFTDMTETIGLFNETPLNLRSFAPRFTDMDGDMYPELLLASDFGTSRYFRNNRNGTFSDVTDSAGTGLDENGMGQTVGDFNGDGLLDWYVTSIYLPPVNQTGNKLYLNLGNHVYTENAVNAGVNNGGYGWGAVSADFNNDGLLDIAETNGDSSPIGPFTNEQSYLWMNSGNGTFTEMAVNSGLAHFGKGRGMINFDYDNDGDQDVVIFANNEPVRLFRNDLRGRNINWLRVFLDSNGVQGLAPNGYGSRVIVTVRGESQLRYITGGDNFLSHSEQSAHFGLGSVNTVDELRVEWANGKVTILTDIAVNQTITVNNCVPTCSILLTGSAPVFGVDICLDNPCTISRPVELNIWVEFQGQKFVILNHGNDGSTVLPAGFQTCVNIFPAQSLPSGMVWGIGLVDPETGEVFCVDTVAGQ